MERFSKMIELACELGNLAESIKDDPLAKGYVKERMVKVIHRTYRIREDVEFAGDEEVTSPFDTEQSNA